MPNMNKLKGKILENEYTYADCADALGISRTSFASKINNKTESGFGLSEVSKLAEFLKLSNEEKLSIFFN